MGTPKDCADDDICTFDTCIGGICVNRDECETEVVVPPTFETPATPPDEEGPLPPVENPNIDQGNPPIPEIANVSTSASRDICLRKNQD